MVIFWAKRTKDDHRWTHGSVVHPWSCWSIISGHVMWISPRFPIMFGPWWGHTTIPPMEKNLPSFEVSPFVSVSRTSKPDRTKVQKILISRWSYPQNVANIGEIGYIDWFGSGGVKIDWLRLALIVSGSMIHFQDASAKGAKCREPQRIPKFTPQLDAKKQNQWPRSPKNHCSTSSCCGALVFPSSSMAHPTLRKLFQLLIWATGNVSTKKGCCGTEPLPRWKTGDLQEDRSYKESIVLRSEAKSFISGSQTTCNHP